MSYDGFLTIIAIRMILTARSPDLRRCILVWYHGTAASIGNYRPGNIGHDPISGRLVAGPCCRFAERPQCS